MNLLGTGHAQQSNAETAIVNGEIDVSQVEEFFDGAVGTLQKVHKIPGITVSVVKDGELLFSDGYGFLDVERLRSVDPETSLFRIGTDWPFMLSHDLVDESIGGSWANYQTPFVV